MNSLSGKLAIIGAGGHARVVISLMNSLGLKPVAIYDSSFHPELKESILEVPLLGKPEDLPSSYQAVLAIGDSEKRANASRDIRCYQTPLIHPTAFIDSTALIEGASQVLPNAVVHSLARIGKHCIINTGATVEHESSVGDYSHISVNAAICGRSHVGKYCMLGAGATIIDGISIADYVTIGAGAVVTENLTAPGTYVGVPAKKIK